MTQIERELAEYLLHLSVTIGPRPLGSAAHAAAVDYVGEAFADWGFAVECRPRGHAAGFPTSGDAVAAPAWSQQGGAAWRVVGCMGLGLPNRVQLRARLDSTPASGGDASAASLAVLMALGRLLAQHRLRHGLEVVAFSGDQAIYADEQPTRDDGAGQIVAALSFDGPGQTWAPNAVSARGASPALAGGVCLLLSRYPEVVWAGQQAAVRSEGAPPGLWVGAAGQATGPATHSTSRLREAAMLGAEIVALLQNLTAATSRAGGQVVRSGGGQDCRAA